MKWTDLNLSSLQYFVDAIELGSLTKAAEKNNVTRPAVSQAIKRTENILGYDLIIHSKNNLELTPNGKKFFKKAKASIELFCKTLSSNEEGATPIRIVCSATLAEYLVIPAIKKLKSVSPGQIQIQIGTTAKVRQLIADGEARLGIMIDDGKTYGLDSVLLGKGSYVARSSTGALKDPLITTENRPEVVQLQKTLKKNGISFEQHHQIESWAVCKKTAELLGGTCLLPDIIPAQPLKNVRDFKYSFDYEIKAIFQNSNALNEVELNLIKILQG